LEDCNNWVQAEVQPLIEDGKRYGLTLCSGGWTDINRHPLINILVNTPMPGLLFVASENTEGFTKDAEYLAEMLGKHIEAIGAQEVICVVTDKLAACVSTGEILEASSPHISWVGCAALISCLKTSSN
jgi:hypothetical protein